MIYSNGKLLLTGEYFVLNGAEALALPLKLGQSMKVTKQGKSDIKWKSFDKDGEIWFETVISIFDLSIISTSDEKRSELIVKIIKTAINMNPSFLATWVGFNIKTYLDFDVDWGLGSSSTLVANIANWAEVNPFLLQFESMGGSAYDIACAISDGPILYKNDEEELRYSRVDFMPNFIENLFFVYLNKKQSSASAIEYFQGIKTGLKDYSKRISDISNSIIESNNLIDFEKLLEEHENIISAALKLDKAKDLYFSDYWGSIKSLGAWGGDFVLATSKKSYDETKSYFESKGFDTVLKYNDLVL